MIGAGQSVDQASQREHSATITDDQQYFPTFSNRRKCHVLPDCMLESRDASRHSPVRPVLHLAIVQRTDFACVMTRATQRGGSIHLDSLASFRQTLQLTQDRIISHVGHRIDNFFEDAQYNWVASSPPSSSTEPSSYLLDLTEFLSTVMMSVLIQLPEFSKDYVYRGALEHCAGVLMVSLSIPACV